MHKAGLPMRVFLTPRPLQRRMEIVEPQATVTPAAESRRLAEYIPGPQRPKTFGGRTRGEERRRLAVSPLGLMSVEDELKIALCVEEEAILEDAFMVDREA